MCAIAMSISEVPITISNSISFIIKKMPRQSIKINEFTITFNDDGWDQMGKAIDATDADILMYKNIMESNYIEQDILPKDNINDAIEYLKNIIKDSKLKEYSKVPQIEELYEALFKRETFRHCSVYVSDKNNSKIISAANVGIQHENIDPNELQQLVDFAYSYDQSNKIMVLFACYLLYERIHPHEDGNVRMGRLLFLENIYQLSDSFIPLSSALRYNKQVKQLLNEVFKSIDFGEIMKKRQIKSGDAAIYRVEIQEIDLNKFYEMINDNQRTKQQYYTLDLNDNTTERIAAEQRSRAQQKYRIQRQKFRATANDLQLLLIRRLQKTIITKVQDLFYGGLDLNSIQDRKTRQDRKVRDTKSCRTVGQMDRLRFHPQFDIKHIGMNIIAQNQHNRYRYMKTY
ncbi:MAG: hypothetical protein EZS28_012645 [Streblomastix strix]|uniref:Fido domain-containing protein n=1 Tax=Streblomastix strix TaxID=222440 RepID=A0A5J4WAY9_9EUKA|nr:MAG: hypothetical protein EZS28_012645 [Streblomastix strix]